MKTCFRSRPIEVSYLFALPMVVAVVFAFLLPYGASFLHAFKQESNALDHAAIYRITLFTLKQAFLSVVVSLALGLPGALFLGSANGKSTPFLRAIFSLPFAMPSILVVLGFVLFFGNSGWLNQIIGAIFPGEGNQLKILYKSNAIILAHGFFNFPLVIRLAGDGISRIRKNYAHAAASLGASPIITFLTVIVPLSFPAIISAALLVFLYSFTSFAVVLVLGGGPASTTLAVEIYRHAKIFLNYQNAGILALIETFFAVLVYLVYTCFWKKSEKIETEIEEFKSGKKNNSKTFKLFFILYGIIILIFILGPIFSIVLESFLIRPSRSAGRVPGLRWWLSFAGSSFSDTFVPAFFRSLLLAFLSASLSCILAILSAGSLTLREKLRGRNYPGGGFIRFLGTSPIVSSGIVLGLGWLIMYGRKSSPVSLIILHGVITLPFAFNSIYEAFRSLPANMLASASVLGAGPLKTIFTVALPLSIKRIGSAWSFAAALSLGELNAVIMLGMEKWETLPLYIYRAGGAYRYGTACAAGTLLMICCTFCFLLSEKFRNYL